MMFQAEIEAIYEEENIASLLNGLDEMVENTAEKEKTRWYGWLVDWG